MKKIKERLRKILALVKGGVEGEKEAAKFLLNKLLKEYQVKLEDIEEEEVNDYCFKYRSVLERRLMHQIYWSVTSSKDGYFLQSSKEFVCSLTEVQKVIFTDLKEFYLREYRVEKKRMEELFITAFIHKYNIYGKSENKKEEKEEKGGKYSAKELATIEAIMENIKKKSSYRKING